MNPTPPTLLAARRTRRGFALPARDARAEVVREAGTPPLRSRAGFTLIELLVAIAILGILGTVVIQKVWSHIDEAKQTSTITKLKEVHTQVQMYRRKHNVLPGSLEDMTEVDPMNTEPWLNAEDILDAWDTPMELRPGNKPGEFEIVSLGQNKAADDFSADLGFDRDLSSTRPLNDPTANR